MKKALIIIIILINVIIVNAQENKISYGAKAGVNFATFSNESSNDLYSELGFHIGVLVEIPFFDKLTIQPELLFSRQGANYAYSEKTFISSYPYSYLGTRAVFLSEAKTGYQHNIHLSYLNFPIIVKYYIYNTFNIEVGPQIGFLFSAEETYIYEGSFYRPWFGPNSGTYDKKKELNTIDFSYSFGVGYELKQGIFFNTRINSGITNLFKENNNSIKNSVLQISTGYKF